MGIVVGRPFASMEVIAVAMAVCDVPVADDNGPSELELCVPVSSVDVSELLWAWSDPLESAAVAVSDTSEVADHHALPLSVASALECAIAGRDSGTSGALRCFQ